MKIGDCARSLAVGIPLLVLVIAGCSGGKEETQSRGGTATTDRSGVERMPESGAEFASQGEVVSGPQVAQDDFGRKIVKTAELGIRAEDVRSGAARAQEVAARVGGSILSAQTYSADNSVYADMIISVPSNEFEGTLDELRALGEEVTTDTISGQDVTEEYVDLKSRERNLLAAEQTLLGLYDRADDVQDALSIQRELTDVRGQIEQVQGRIKYLDQRSDFAQISLSIRPVASPPKPRPAWDPKLIVARAWSASLAVLQALATVFLSAIVFGWWLVPVLIAGTWWLRRRLRRSSFVQPEP
ncbi:MAG TPA: DUF4349 domain-containing protein [Rubrobacter sp.]|nr:DUF4349 domain-containing protein [Rubrobacter sp.]